MAILKLVERDRVKNLLGIALADTLQDSNLNAMIEQISEECETYCRRSFTKRDRVELYQSYDQYPNDPSPQFIWLNGPVDESKGFEVVYAPNNRHDELGVTVDKGDLMLDRERSLIILSPLTTFQSQLIPFLLRGTCFQYSPTGFRVRYTGGYEVPNPTPEVPGPFDPLDDFDVVSVPNGLKSILARKIQTDFLKGGILQPWTDAEIASLKTWTKKDQI